MSHWVGVGDAGSVELPEAYYLPLDDDTFESTAATTSPWDLAAQHGGPPSALLARAVDRTTDDPAFTIARLTVDMLIDVLQAPQTAYGGRPGDAPVHADAAPVRGQRVRMGLPGHLATPQPTLVQCGRLREPQPGAPIP